MKRSAFLIIAIFTLLLPQALWAEAIPEGGGIVYGEGFAFNLKAPKGWVLDTSSGNDQGMHAVFYPKGSSWSDSVVVAYARSRPKSPQVKTAAEAAQDTVAQFKKSGNPNHKSEFLKNLKTSTGQEVQLYRFSGDQWGNNEAVAYFVEKDRINFLVLSSRDAKVFDQSLPVFEELAKSYLPMTATIKKPPQ